MHHVYWILSVEDLDTKEKINMERFLVVTDSKTRGHVLASMVCKAGVV